MKFLTEKYIPIILFFIFIFFLQGVVNLPVMDRDEARFATASKTMIETKDFIDIKMQDEVRYKKPIGIYWLQSVSNYFFGDTPFDKIWVYRIPSILGIIFTFFLINNYSRKIFGKEISYLSIIFIVTSLLTISEIHQAKTDGILFLTITLCNLIILKALNEKSLNFRDKLIYWVTLGLGILVKGPIIIIFTVLPLTGLCLCKKKNLFKEIWSPFGFLIFLIISIPWFIIITVVSNGLFWHESVIHDLYYKVKSGQESHGFPPGYYSLLFLVMFWPGVIFVPSLLKKIYNEWKVTFFNNECLLFVVLWFLIPFLIYEIIPTKLPHYIFPSYVALSILISKTIVDNKNFNKLLGYLPLFFLCLYPISILTAKVFVIHQYSHLDFKIWIIVLTLLILLALQIVNFLKKKMVKLLTCAILFQSVVYLSAVYYMVPKLEVLWVSEKINNVINKNINQVDKVFHYGFNEPSLIFLTSHKAKRKNINEYKKLNSSEKILYISTNTQNHRINENKFSDVKIVDQFEGFNYSQGKKVLVKFFIIQ